MQRVDATERLLTRFGSLRGVLNATRSDLGATHGIGKVRLATLSGLERTKVPAD